MGKGLLATLALCFAGYLGITYALEPGKPSAADCQKLNTEFASYYADWAQSKLRGDEQSSVDLKKSFANVTHKQYLECVAKLNGK
jgi:hypothetical protein